MPKPSSGFDTPMPGAGRSGSTGALGKPGIEAPAIGLPKGGGAIRGLDATFAADGATGGGGMSVALPLPADRTGAPPAIGLVYGTQAANGPFGRGWALTIPAITRKVSNGLPRYLPGEDDDTYLLDGRELVPALRASGGGFEPDMIEEAGFRYERFRPRILANYDRIERITRLSDGDVHWRVVNAHNGTQRFGLDASARVADPASPHRIFSWLLSESFDDRGNAALYRWKAEDGHALADIHERTRIGALGYAQRYPKRIFYANATPRVPDENLAARTDWLFEAVIDYGDHPDDTPEETRPWALRQDPVSDCRAGFEIRTWRLAQRVLVFHRFAELGSKPVLTRAMTLRYRSLRGVAEDAVRGAPDGAFLVGVSEHGYGPDAAGDPERLASPTLTFDYALPVFSPRVEDLPTEAIENWPDGAGGSASGFFDLSGEGLPGLLSAEGGAWRYSANRGGHFAPIGLVEPRPVPAPTKDSRDILVDITGDGPLALVSLRPERAGYFRQDMNGDWDGLRPFETVPRIDWSDPDLRLMDVTGTGNLDVVIARGDGVTWFAGRGEDGFSPGVFVPFAGADRWVFDCGETDLLTADMTGDGLPDLVRIGPKGIVYRQNLGYGRFGPEIVMSAPPALQSSGEFDLRRLRLADLDGDGAADLVHIGTDRVTLYLNHAGNSWSAPLVIEGLSGIADSDTFDIVDLFGTDTPCLVWSRSTPGTAPVRLRYADLLGGRKPHLMTRFDNGIGKRVEMEYTPSTRFYLDDLAAGNPWIGRLGFVVHCLSRLTTRDLVRETVFTTTYSYHHGFYDGKEREFRGFGRIDRRDTDIATAPVRDPLTGTLEDGILTQPPVLTRLWTHTGVKSAHQLVPADFSAEYWVNPVLPEWPTSAIVLPQALSPEERADAIRALAGAPLRQEIHGEDGGPAIPYVTGRQSYSVRRIQPATRTHPAVFQLLPDETIAHAYDRIADDPRIEQQMTLARDDLGLPVLAATIVHGRATVDPSLPPSVRAAQAARIVQMVETDYTGDVLGGSAANPVHRLRTLAESRNYEVTGLTPGMLTRAQLAAELASAAPLAFEAALPAGPRKRLLGRSRAVFLKDDLSGPLPLRQIGARGLPYETYTLAFTDSFLSSIYGARVDAAMLAGAGYIQFAGEDGWWIPSGRPIFDAGAPGRFYLPLQVQSATGAITTIAYDAYAFMALSATDPVGNTIVATIDYRTLSAAAITDANGMVSEVRTDALGRVTRLSMRGPGGEGTALDDPATLHIYDHLAFEREGKPAMAITRERESFGAATRWLESRTYTDGSGNPVMAKIMAPGGLAKQVQPDGTVIEVDTGAAPRWIGNGRTILDNKGNAIRRYQPYYSTSPDFETARDLVGTGAVSDALYDPVGRLIRLDLPDGRHERVEIRPWSLLSYDPIDTVLESRWYADRGSPAPTDSEPADPERRAAWLSARNANTPAQTHLDALGRVVFSVADNGAEGLVTARFDYEAGNRITRSFDALDRLVASSSANLAGATVLSEGAERGERRVFSDAEGRDTHVWDRSGLHRSTFDPMGRPVSGFHQPPSGPETRHTHAVYGDSLAAPPAGARGRLLRLYDTAGVMTMAAFDWRGLPVRIERRLTANPETVPDWQVIGTATDPATISALVEPLLEAEVFVSTASFDALGRPDAMTLPDGSSIAPAYDLATRLSGLQAAMPGDAAVSYLNALRYDATGQRKEIAFGNGVVTRYEHDTATGRLDRLITLKAAGDAESSALQALAYVYDAAGNPVEIGDWAQQTRYFDNAVVSATRRFAYDAIGRLVEASGREHATIGLSQPANDDLAPFGLPHANDANAVRRYTERYAYDALGNLLSLRHVAGPAQWTRRYRYATEIAGNRTNRLLATSLPGDAPG
ncbi:MAG: SpvB/TcaC N-terminal domain-containing protein, partial [Beijerinckiaceae bacterium]|nr:SpvB/TcaC N-terminal domain-containing protein [Beijerinckiaceae bacterium]